MLNLESEPINFVVPYDSFALKVMMIRELV